MSILGIQASDTEPTMVPRRHQSLRTEAMAPGLVGPTAGAVEPWERFVGQLQRISLRPVALRIREWLAEADAPLWEIITPDIELADANKHFTLPTTRGRGTTARAAAEDFMSFLASAFDHRCVLAVFCRDQADKRNSKWAFYAWDDERIEFVECERPTPEPEPMTAPEL